MLYISPLKALAVDIERNLRAPLAGIANRAVAARRRPPRAVDRHPDRRHAGDRAGPLPARAGRHPDHHAGIAVPAADLERARGAALASTRSSSTRSTRWSRPSAARTWRCRWSGSRRLRRRSPHGSRVQRIGLSATQRPLDEVARFLGGRAVQDGTPRRRQAGAEHTAESTGGSAAGEAADRQPDDAIHERVRGGGAAPRASTGR